MRHVVLLGDSIFDNARYVPDRPPVITQLRRSLPAGWRATLCAVDGNVSADVVHQLADAPADATHFFVSAGGNDALGESYLLADVTRTLGHALDTMHDIQARFCDDYSRMLKSVLAAGKPTAVCTIYDAIPILETAAKTALAVFNDVILREAFRMGIPVIDLRLACNHPGDFSPLSPIEPSVAGGSKIARAIAEVAARHDFAQARSTVYF